MAKKTTTKVIVYSTPSCPYCHMAKDYLKEHKIPFQDINVAEDAKAGQEMVKKSGQRGVPVIDIDGEIIIGFDQDAIAAALGIEE
ncbi:glutathione S-transferase N-terminal domain-containing protein [Candidatus Woesearchaeota archaeon]|nr:glutathione S-transferase N-terminal domain-containing protein [Candidatus Woesearchaeota archaeon]